MRVTFWGTRGSIAKPGPDTVRYGGNTSCVEVMSAAGSRLVLDCGTGAHALGQALVATPNKASKGHLLIGHTHWDHIQGLPFFAPLFVAGNEWDVYAPQGLGARLRETLAGQMQYTYFPVALEELGATIRYHDLTEGSLTIGGMSVKTQYLNHPAPTLAYRIEIGGVAVVYATDHEPHARPLPGSDVPLPGAAPLDALHAEDRRHVEFVRGADLLIHDAQYTSREYPARVGWGHSTIDYVVGLAMEAGVKQLALFHHDPMRTDDELDAIVVEVRARVTAAGSSLHVFAAAEGRSVELVESAAAAAEVTAAQEVREAAEACAPTTPVVFVVSDEAAAYALVEAALGPIGLRTERVDPAAADLAARCADERPALLLIARRGAAWDGLDLCRAVHARAEVPIVLVSSATDTLDMAAGFEAGASDWLTRPCSAAFIQARARAWIVRAPVRWHPAPVGPGEEERLRAVARLDMGSRPSDGLDRILRLATRALDVPYASVNLIERDREWRPAAVGGPCVEVPRDVSVCAHAILDDAPMVLPDTHADARFADNPFFHGDFRVRFYASTPIKSPDGFRVGTVCILDVVPRRLEQGDLRTLSDLAALVEAELRG